MDYLTPTTVPVMSDNSFLEAVIEVRDDNITERPESFRIVLNTTSCPEVIIPGGAEITVTIIDKTGLFESKWPCTWSHKRPTCAIETHSLWGQAVSRSREG